MRGGEPSDRQIGNYYSEPVLVLVDARDADDDVADGGDAEDSSLTTSRPHAAGRTSTLPGRSGAAAGRGRSRAAVPSRRRAGGTSSSASAAESATSRSDYSLHLVVTASVGGCLLVFNVTLFFFLYCRRRVRLHSAVASRVA